MSVSGESSSAVPVARTLARVVRSAWPGWIWAVPIAAIGIVVWLMLRALSSRGFEVTLILADAGGLSVNNTAVIYRGLNVGTLIGLALAPDGRHVLARLDIDADMDRYVRRGTRFYIEGREPSIANLASLRALIAGPVIELVPGAGARSRRFVAIMGAPAQHFAVSLPYLVRFTGAVGALPIGAPVTLRGFTVGEVVSVALHIDPRSGAIDTPVGLDLDPTRFHLEEAAPPSGDWSAPLDAALARLIARGLRAELAQAPPLIGSEQVVLATTPSSGEATLRLGGEYPEIPAGKGTGLEAFVTELDQLPLPQIAANVRDASARLRTLAASPQLDQSIAHLDHALAELDRTLYKVGPEIPPTLESVQQTVASLRTTATEIDATAAAARSIITGGMAAPGEQFQQALEELTDAARSIRSLADYLDQHPNALIRGR